MGDELCNKPSAAKTPLSALPPAPQPTRAPISTTQTNAPNGRTHTDPNEEETLSLAAIDKLAKPSTPRIRHAKNDGDENLIPPYLPLDV
jgi:hypothetical protein